MDPEHLRALWAEVQSLRSEGMSDREISRELRRIREVPFNSVRSLREHMEAAGLGTVEAAERGEVDDGRPENPMAVATPLIQGLSGGLASDVLSGLEKINLAPEGAAEGFQEDLGEARERAGLAAHAVQGVGLLAGPGKVGGRLISRVSQAAGRGAARAALGVARSAGAGALGQLGASAVARGAGATLAGAAGGAAEGALLGFGESFGGTPEERADAALVGGMFGTIAGPLEGVRAGARGARELNRAVRERGEVLAEAGERVGRGLPTRRTVASRVEAADDARRAAFDQAEAAGQNLPPEVTETLATNDIARRAIRNAANQGSPEAQRFLRHLERFELTQQLNQARQAGDDAAVRRLTARLARAGGATNHLPAASFDLADDVRKQLGKKGSGFATRGPDAAAAPPSAGAVEEATRVKGLLDTALGEVDGFEDALRATARANNQRRALDTGRKMASKSFTADEIEDVLAGKTITRGKSKVRIGNSREAQEAFRSGLAIPVMQRLRGGAAGAESFLNELATSSELQRRMRVILGGQDELRAFMAEAERLAAIGQAHRIQLLLIKAAGFLAGGTSLFGGALEVGLFGG